MGLYEQIKEGLLKTRNRVATSLDQLFRKKDISFYQDLEDLLISADMGPVVSESLVQDLKNGKRTIRAPLLRKACPIWNTEWQGSLSRTLPHGIPTLSTPLSSY